MKQSIILIVSVLILSSCQTTEEKKVVAPEYSFLRLQPERDSLFFSANSGSQQFSLVGSIINTSEITVTNNGIMTEASYVVRTIDTSYETVDPNTAQWYSTNTSVATVNKGLVTAKNPGYTSIKATIGNTSSKSVIVNVRAVDVAPGLSLNPPDIALIFENSISVSGVVQSQSKLRISEQNSGFLKDTLGYKSDGTFALTVTSLNQGIRTIVARATHPTNSNLYSERTKTVIYYEPNTPGANSIVGNWQGTTLGKKFNFKIENSIIPTRYDITGKLDIQFPGIGLVQDIDLIGLVNNNGTFNVSLSKSYQGFSISGKFNGYFQSTGTASGTYAAQAVKSGWPKISFSDTWTAVKLP